MVNAEKPKSRPNQKNKDMKILIYFFRWVIISLVAVSILFASCKDKDKDTSTPTNTLTVNINPVGAGVVLKDPDQIKYEINTQANLTAIPNLGYYFSEWSGDASGSSNPFIITFDSDKIVNADFKEGVFEDFNDGVADYFITDGSGRWTVTNNAYKMSGAHAKTTAYSYYPHYFNDFRLSVNIKAANNNSLNNAFGVYFKSQSAEVKNNSYRVSINRSGKWYLGKYVNGTFTYITDSWIFSNDINTDLNATNNIVILFVGTRVDIYFNNVHQGYAQNLSNFTSGYIGVQGYDSDVNYNEFFFDDFIIVTTEIDSYKSTTLHNILDHDLTNIKGTKGDPDGNNF